MRIQKKTSIFCGEKEERSCTTADNTSSNVKNLEASAVGARGRMQELEAEVPGRGLSGRVRLQSRATREAMHALFGNIRRPRCVAVAQGRKI